MAHSLLHYSVGCIAGTMFMLPPVLLSMTAGKGLARTTGKWLLTAHACGVFAVVPGILRRLGLPDQFCDGWWMNLFFLHPLVNQLKHGGMLVGEMMLFLCIALQYILLLEAVLIARKKGSSLSAP